ncbi:MAG: hypothetical protein IT342_01320 [Candidatus Melainabacteria bacterium]|nr:hypothetical protein [Candidatus Melainabacteria bacterium]
MTILCGCASTQSPDEELARKVFDSIKNNDADAFSKLTITRADFELSRDKVSPMKAHLTYAGGTLRPEQRRAQILQFEKAQEKGNDAVIDFKHSEFVGIEDFGSSLEPLLGGGEIPVRPRKFKIRRDGKEVDSSQMEPLLLLTDWKGKPRCLGLIFRDAPQAQETETSD